MNLFLKAEILLNGEIRCDASSDFSLPTKNEYFIDKIKYLKLFSENVMWAR